MTGAEANAMAGVLKPVALLALTFVFAVVTWLVRRFSPPRLQRVLLYKLWDIHPKPRPLHLGNYNVGQVVVRPGHRLPPLLRVAITSVPLRRREWQ